MSEEEDEQEAMPIINSIFKKKKNKKKKPKPQKHVAPDIIFVLDDLSTELRYKSVATLLKSNRHYRCKVILSSQYLHDLEPQSIAQLDYMLLFGGQTLDKL